MREESGGVIGAKINRNVAVKCGRTEWLPEEFEAAEIEAHPHFEKDKYMTKCWSKNL